MPAPSNNDDGVLFSFNEEVTVGSVIIPPQREQPPTHPCGRDCVWARESRINPWAPWLRCVHPSGKAISSEGRECMHFEAAPPPASRPKIGGLAGDGIG